MASAGTLDAAVVGPVEATPVASDDAKVAASDLEVAMATGLGVLVANTAGFVRDTHLGIARRVFGELARWTGPAARPVQVAHDVVSRSVYGTVRVAGRLAGRALGAAAAARARPVDDVPLDARPGVAVAIGALNGLHGDALERDLAGLATAMQVRAGGAVVAPTRASLAAAFPDATDRVVVLAHGLCETEHAWRFGAGRRGRTYLDAWSALGWTPVTVRYNTGRHVSENGRELSELLEQVLGAWPTDVAHVALVGHSMGGLVGRAAAHLADIEGRDWVRRVRLTVTLGTPHGGASLEQAVARLTRGMRDIPEAAGVVSLLDARSDGIRDLRFGSLVDEDWRGRTDDELMEDLRAEVPLLDGVRHVAVAATLTRDPAHPVARALGDLLVLEASASGLGRRVVGFSPDDTRHVGGVNHLALLNDGDVEALVADLLDDVTAGRATPRAR